MRENRGASKRRVLSPIESIFAASASDKPAACAKIKFAHLETSRLVGERHSIEGVDAPVEVCAAGGRRVDEKSAALEFAVFERDRRRLGAGEQESGERDCCEDQDVGRHLFNR